jgi:hypothetical protein
MLSGHGRITDCFADCGRHRGVEAEYFLANTIKKGKRFEVRMCNWLGGMGNSGADFSAKTVLDFWVEGKKVARPG